MKNLGYNFYNYTLVWWPHCYICQGSNFFDKTYMWWYLSSSTKCIIIRVYFWTRYYFWWGFLLWWLKLLGGHHITINGKLWLHAVINMVLLSWGFIFLRNCNINTPSFWVGLSVNQNVNSIVETIKTLSIFKYIYMVTMIQM